MRLRLSAGLISLLFQSSGRLSVAAAEANHSAAFVVPATSPNDSLKSSAFSTMKGSTSDNNETTRNKSSYPAIDPDYPGTAVERMMNARERVRMLEKEQKLMDTPWEQIRKQILWAGGLKDLPKAIPGQGYTGHSFNDFNHVDLTCMRDETSDNENDGRVQGIALGNRLGNGIRVASLEELGSGGSWSTCAMGCNKEPPQDVAHLQFQARIAFKLVWVPNDDFDKFVLVDDAGDFLALGKPLPPLPSMRERVMNYQIVQGSKYAKVAERIAKEEQAQT